MKRPKRPLFKRRAYAAFDENGDVFWETFAPLKKFARIKADNNGVHDGIIRTVEIRELKPKR